MVIIQMKKVSSRQKRYNHLSENVYCRKISLQLRQCHSWLQCCKFTVGKHNISDYEMHNTVKKYLMSSDIKLVPIHWTSCVTIQVLHLQFLSIFKHLCKLFQPVWLWLEPSTCLNTWTLIHINRQCHCLGFITYILHIAIISGIQLIQHNEDAAYNKWWF